MSASMHVLLVGETLGCKASALSHRSVSVFILESSLFLRMGHKHRIADSWVASNSLQSLCWKARKETGSDVWACGVGRQYEEADWEGQKELGHCQGCTRPIHWSNFA